VDDFVACAKAQCGDSEIAELDCLGMTCDCSWSGSVMLHEEEHIRKIPEGSMCVREHNALKAANTP